MITDYTTPEEVRAVLGVSDEDIEDETLLLPVYENYLVMELEDISLTLPSTYQTVKAQSTHTESEIRFLQAASLFATIALAKQLAGSLPMFAAKQVTDSKAAVQRFDNPYKDTIASIKNDYDRMRNRLIQALGAIGTSTGTTTKRVFMSVVSPSSDPVTGV